jgi:seryl-tRNA synthetase
MVASKVSGNGFYYLKNEAALLEVALISYAFNFAVSRGTQSFLLVLPVRRKLLFMAQALLH